MAISKISREYMNKGPFTFDDLYDKYKNENTRKTLHNFVHRGLKNGQIHQVKRGLYYVTLPFQENFNYQPDSFLVASKLSEDTVIGFHSALALHGVAYSDFKRVYFFTNQITRKFEFQGVEYIPVQKKISWGIETVLREGNIVKVTDRERTFLDCLDRINYAGGLEEFMKSVEMFPSIDFEKLEGYLEKFDKNILYGKAGFVLEKLASAWSVSEDLLAKLEKKVEEKVSYFATQIGDGIFIKRWNLIVPKNLEALLRAV